MTCTIWLAGAALVLTPALALAGNPESLLPPIFANPAPAPAPAPRPSAAPRPAAPAAPVAGTASGGVPAAVAVPGAANDSNLLPTAVPKDLPSIEELEKMDTSELDELFGLKPKYDIPPGARRSLEEVGVLAASEGGFAPTSLAAQPASLVRAALAGTKGPLVSRWGHILLRRALASRLDAPRDMDPVEFAALRAALLNRMGEGAVARRLVQDVDSANYDEKLASAALDAYLETGDLVGICPVAQLKGNLREDGEWQMVQAICDAYDGEARTAERDLDRILSRGTAPRIDVLLAQRFAGAAGEGRRAVNIEWKGVDELTRWRLSLARALGVEIPESLRNRTSSRLMRSTVLIPAVPLAQRAAAADRAGGDGILSAHAMVDLYSQIWSDDGIDDPAKDRASLLRAAYVAAAPADRIAAIEAVWGGGEAQYGRQVLTAYASARLPVDKNLLSDPSPFIASMLTAGLDRNALRWSDQVDEGSRAWGLLALAQPDRQDAVSSGALDEYIDNDDSVDKRKSRFLVAGLAGLGRLGESDASSAANRLGVSLTRDSKWSRAIDMAGQSRNKALVALLAGLGMQGSGWDKMTTRHLFHIVRALNRAGLGAEARMIAAEAVARG